MSPLLISQELMEPWLLVNYVLLISLSLIVVYQAYRGYRRNDSRPMLFLAFGVILLTIVPVVVSIVAARFVSAVVYGSTVAPLIQSIRVVGLASIVYSLYGYR